MSTNFFTNLTKEGSQVPCAYIGIEGPQGSGKSVTAGLIALGLSVEYHNRAPVVWDDSEGGANFLQPMYEAEGVDLLWKPTVSLSVVSESIRQAEAIGACAIIGDSVTKFWRNTVRSFMEEKSVTTMQEMLPYWTACKEPWFDLMDQLKFSRLHKIICGRGGFEFESVDVLNDDGEIVNTTSVRGAHKMKAETEAGHEPDLNLHMESVTDPNAGSTTRQKIGRLLKIASTAPRKLHIATVEKGRTWQMNGKVFQWPDRDSYKAGEYALVLDCLRPYLDTLKIGGQHRGNSNEAGPSFRRSTTYTGQHTQKQIAIENWDALFQVMGLAGQTTKEKNLRALIGREIAAGIMSRTEFERQKLDDLRFQVLVLKKLSERAEQDAKFLDLEKKSELLAVIEAARKEAGFEWQVLKGQGASSVGANGPNGHAQTQTVPVPEPTAPDPMEVF